MSHKLVNQKYLLAFTAICTSLCIWSDDVQSNSQDIYSETNIVPIISQPDTIAEVNIDFLDFLVKAVVIDKQSGAIGRNRKGFVSVGFQRYSSRFIAYGILTKNVELIDIGIKIIDYPLSFQQSDGSFNDYSPNNRGKSSASSVAFYLNDSGESLLLCLKSRWFQESSETDELRSKIARMQPSISKSLTWLISKESELIKGDGNGRATNRLWKDANAYYLTGKALNRKDAQYLGEKFADLSLQQQNLDGAFLEKLGFDSSYQGVSIREALLFYANLESQSKRKPIVLEAIHRAVRLELKYILSNGEVLTKGNTRVFVGGETYFGKEKKIDYLALVLGLNYYYQITKNLNIKNISDRVFNFYTSKRS